MPADQRGAAKLYTVNREDTPYQVVYRDPTRREKSGRAKRVVTWFARQEDAEEFRDKMDEQLLIEGAVGVHFDAQVRGDAIAARRKLDAAGHRDVSLLHLATNYCAKVTHHAAAGEPIGPAMQAFLHEKEVAEGRAKRSLDNLRNRLWAWINREKIVRVGDVTRDRVEPLRTRLGEDGKPVSPQTRRNDINAVSSFCTFLVDRRKIEVHPLKGLRRPFVPWRAPAIFTAEECGRLLHAAWKLNDYDEALATLAVMIFVGTRPSELAQTRLYYGRHPVAKIEGGKLRGRANRVVPLMPAAVAWLKLAGSPEVVLEMSQHARRRTLKEAGGLTWKEDICRHTFISHQTMLLNNDGAVAKEAGTSEQMIFRHYRRSVTAGEARAWAALRPKMGKR